VERCLTDLADSLSLKRGNKEGGVVTPLSSQPTHIQKEKGLPSKKEGVPGREKVSCICGGVEQDLEGSDQRKLVLISCE